MTHLFKKTCLSITLVLVIFTLLGCQPETETPIIEEKHPYAGTYALLSKTVDDFDMTAQYVYAIIELTEENEATLSEVDLYGLNEQKGSYTYTETTVTIQIGLRQYEFNYESDNQILAFSGRISRKEVTMRYQKVMSFTKPNTSGGVAFTEQLFGESLDENYYNYAPAILMEGTDTMHVWFCGNGVSGNVTDYIVYRKGTLQGDGTWVFTDRELVLSSTAGTWDQRHVCDPTVIKGAFKYKGMDYGYLMSFLGCVTNDSSRNEVGIALSQSLAGPWIKVDEINPIANYYTSEEYVDDRWTWGYGQPSLVSVDESGKVILFYTKGVISGTHVHAELWDLSNLDNPVKLDEAPITNAGVVNASGGADVINNADFAYDPVKKRLYVIKEDFPYASGGGTDWLTGSNTVMYLNLNPEEAFPMQTLFNGETLRWQAIKSVGTNETGHKRVHNSGIVRNEYGWLMNPHQLPILYTKSDVSDDFPDWPLKGQWPALHTYRIYGYLIEL